MQLHAEKNARFWVVSGAAEESHGCQIYSEHQKRKNSTAVCSALSNTNPESMRVQSISLYSSSRKSCLAPEVWETKPFLAHWGKTTQRCTSASDGNGQEQEPGN